MQNRKKNCVFLASGCSSVARSGSGQQWGGGGNSAGGAGNSGGSTAEGSSTSKNRPSHRKYKSPKQFELKELKGSKST